MRAYGLWTKLELFLAGDRIPLMLGFAVPSKDKRTQYINKILRNMNYEAGGKLKDNIER